MSHLLKGTAATLALLLMVNTAAAASFGFFAGIEGGEADFDPDDSSVELDTDTKRYRIGFSFDTAARENKLFSYRLDLALERLDLELKDTPVDIDATFELAGISADNTFAFRLLQTDVLRLWAGPRVRVGFYGGDLDVNIGGNPDIDMDLAEFGVGGVIGANFYTGPSVILSVESGFMLSGFSGEIEDSSGISEDFDGDGASFFLNGVVLF